MNIIETSGLTYEFSQGERILNNIELAVPQGSIYGFLGPNGAGKTTTIRLLLGLLKKQQGSVRIFGKDFKENRIECLSQLGSLIESPSLYLHLTATENLQILRRIYRCEQKRIAEVLEIVGLAHVGKKKVSQFSLGMKQRLSIAMTLLHSPKLLILDEPTNGLDPNGILEMRELLKGLNKEQGLSIMVSSHLLSEVEKLVSHVGIIHKGNLLFQGTLAELGEKQHQLSGVSISTNKVTEAQQLIAALGYDSEILSEALFLKGLSDDKVAQINRELVLKGIDVYRISVSNNDLETIFMDMVK